MLCSVEPEDRAHVWPVRTYDGPRFAVAVFIEGGWLFEGVHVTRADAMEHTREWCVPVFVRDPGILDG